MSGGNLSFSFCSFFTYLHRIRTCISRLASTRPRISSAYPHVPNSRTHHHHRLASHIPRISLSAGISGVPFNPSRSQLHHYPHPCTTNCTCPSQYLYLGRAVYFPHPRARSDWARAAVFSVSLAVVVLPSYVLTYLLRSRGQWPPPPSCMHPPRTLLYAICTYASPTTVAPGSCVPLVTTRTAIDGSVARNLSPCEPEVTSNVPRSLRRSACSFRACGRVRTRADFGVTAW